MMLTNLLSVFLAASVAIASGTDERECSGCYRAAINKHGVDAEVFVCKNGRIANYVQAFLNFKKVNKDVLPPNCNLDTMGYHIHDFWKREDKMAFGAGCAPSFTGGHFDPTLACGRLSGNPLCPVLTGGENPPRKTNYTCTRESYRSDPFGCEVGDLSGKFGMITKEDQGRFLRNEDPFGVAEGQLEGKSIVFHCDGGARAFCAKLEAAPDNYISSYVESSKIHL